MAIQPPGFPTARDTKKHFPLAVCVGRDRIEGSTVAAFLKTVLRYIEEHGAMGKLCIPLSTTGENYLIADEPRQSSGAPFIKYSTYVPESAGRKLFINTNHPRFFGLRQGAHILSAAGFSVTLPRDARVREER